MDNATAPAAHRNTRWTLRATERTSGVALVFSAISETFLSIAEIRDTIADADISQEPYDLSPAVGAQYEARSAPACTPQVRCRACGDDAVYDDQQCSYCSGQGWLALADDTRRGEVLTRESEPRGHDSRRHMLARTRAVERDHTRICAEASL